MSKPVKPVPQADKNKPRRKAQGSKKSEGYLSPKGIKQVATASGAQRRASANQEQGVRDPGSKPMPPMSGGGSRRVTPDMPVARPTRNPGVTPADLRLPGPGGLGGNPADEAPMTPNPHLTPSLFRSGTALDPSQVVDLRGQGGKPYSGGVHVFVHQVPPELTAQGLSGLMAGPRKPAPKARPATKPVQRATTAKPAAVIGKPQSEPKKPAPPARSKAKPA